MIVILEPLQNKLFLWLHISITNFSANGMRIKRHNMKNIRNKIHKCQVYMRSINKETFIKIFFWYFKVISNLYSWDHPFRHRNCISSKGITYNSDWILAMKTAISKLGRGRYTNKLYMSLPWILDTISRYYHNSTTELISGTFAKIMSRPNTWKSRRFVAKVNRKEKFKFRPCNL